MCIIFLETKPDDCRTQIETLSTYNKTLDTIQMVRQMNH